MEDLCYIEFLMKIMIWLKRVLSVESKFFFFFFKGSGSGSNESNLPRDV